MSNHECAHEKYSFINRYRNRLKYNESIKIEFEMQFKKNYSDCHLTVKFVSYNRNYEIVFLKQINDIERI